MFDSKKEEYQNMSNCPHCGAPLSENESVCSYCGSILTSDSNKYGKEGQFFTKPVDDIAAISEQDHTDRRSILLNIVGFLFPAIGLIIYLKNRKTRPVMAESLKVWVLIGFFREMIGSILDEPYNRISSIRFFMDSLL